MTAPRSDDVLRSLSPMQREWYEGIVAPYLDGRQDGCQWALIDNSRGDETRHALQALILVHCAAEARVAEVQRELKLLRATIANYGDALTRVGGRA